jgi:hypothetical protein
MPITTFMPNGRTMKDTAESPLRAIAELLIGQMKPPGTRVERHTVDDGGTRTPADRVPSFQDNVADLGLCQHLRCGEPRNTRANNRNERVAWKSCASTHKWRRGQTQANAAARWTHYELALSTNATTSPMMSVILKSFGV